MKWSNLFNRKNENTFFTKVKPLILKVVRLKEIENLYYLGGFAYNEKALKNIKGLISANALESFLKENSFDSQGDNIELYFLEERSGKKSIIFILDFVELYEKEKILEVIPVKESLSEIGSAEKIY
jgi:hypothetical protein